MASACRLSVGDGRLCCITSRYSRARFPPLTRALFTGCLFFSECKISQMSSANFSTAGLSAVSAFYEDVSHMCQP